MLPVWEHPKSIVDSHTLHQRCSLKIEKKRRKMRKKRERRREK